MTLDDAHARKLRTCNMLIDTLVAAGDGAAAETMDREAMELAMSRALSDGAIVAGWSDEGELQVDATALIFASLDLMMWLTRTLARYADVEPLDVLTDLRQLVSDWQADAEA